MPHPFKAIISDLDGTLLNANHRIGEFTIEVLSKLAKQGVDIYFATGRNYPDVKHIIAKVDVEKAALVTSNGARSNYLSGEVIIHNYLPEDLAFELMNIDFDQTQACLNTYQGDEWFINVDIEQLRKYHQDSGLMYQVVDFSKHHGRQTEKVFFIGKNAEALLPIEEKIRAQFGDRIYMTYSTAVCLEIMNKGVSKANTLAHLIEKQGYSLQDCIAFGDGMNDVEMLAQVGKGCLMENADPRLKATLPNNEVIGHHKDESVARYIQTLFQLD